MAGGLRAVGPKADIALILADEDAVVGGAFTQNVMCAAPVIYCKEVLAKRSTCRAVSLHRHFFTFNFFLLLLHKPRKVTHSLESSADVSNQERSNCPIPRLLLSLG